ncbi:MAG: hypothetical protein KGZ85_00220 [Ignavibacterium sp.]|nr:hypothetical protein [Ignavibacterium sp.]
MKRILFILSLLCFLSVSVFGQAIPKQFDYQGVLKTSAGGVVPDGNYPMTFRIYNDPTGGTALWTETQTVAVANGIFSVHLGSNTAIAGVPFNRIHFLGITLGTEPELLPRTMLTPSPYSFMSMDIMDEAVTTTKIHDGAVTGAKIGSNQVVKSLNGIKDDVTLVAGTNITLTPSGNNITINAAGGGGGGTVTQVNTGAGLTGGPITTTGTISIPNDGITSAMLQSNSVTSAKITDGTIATADLANNSVTSVKIVDATITAADIGATQVVKALNNLKDNVTLVAGSNITITPSGQNLTIASTAGGVGGSGTTNYLPRFSASTTLGNSIIYQSASNIGINKTSPEQRLHVNGAVVLEKSTSAVDRLYLKTATQNDPGRYGIRFSNNEIAPFEGDDIGNQVFSFMSTWGQNRTYDAKLQIVGKGTSTWGNMLELTHNGSRGIISTDVGNIIITPAGGYVGIGTTTPSSTLHALHSNGNYGRIATSLDGIAAYSNISSGYAIYGIQGANAQYAGRFSGNVSVTGTLSKGGGSFKIDHPLDPANKYLYHSFVESPDMMNIYNGNVTTDGSGYAVVSLPDWFEALNKDFRYQLTVIGDFAQAIIAQEVQGNQFAIRTDKPNIKVSWQVTGIRKDAFAEKYRIPVEEIKKDDEIGKYIHPDAFGIPESSGIDYERNRNALDRK